MTGHYWAKKPQVTDFPPTVDEHCRDVLAAADAIWVAVGRELADALGVQLNELSESIRPLLRVASLLHDMAKVNSVFQDMLLGKLRDGECQPVRHEILAAWLLNDRQTLGNWFSRLRPESETWPIIWAIAGHHLKMCDPARLPIDSRIARSGLFTLKNAPRKLVIPLSACGDLLSEATAAIQSSTALPLLLDLQFDVADDGDESLQERIHQFANTSYRAWMKLQRTPQLKQKTALLKALLIAADVAASALVSNHKQPADWIPNQLAYRISAEQLEAVVIKGTRGKMPLAFQVAVGKSDRSATLVVAGCGNGKTTAAYLWAQRWAVGRKLWFTYPTTGTASAGYEGYLFDHPDLISALMHGRAQVDIQAMRGTDEDDRHDEALRLESLRAWECEAIVCTVDTVLGLLQNQRRPLFSFPAIATGVFVFDEIHSYDAKLFGGLLRFLQTFPGSPVLLMSASIPPNRMAALRKVLGPRAGDVISGDSNLEGFQRYRLEPRDSTEACRQEVRVAVQNGKKVMWVCNTVRDAVETARDARDWAGIDSERIVVYHSRFRYRDRVDRQKSVIAEFAYQQVEGRKHLRAIPAGGLVIATQVCEMSLDISADLLITAECPLPSLVQRLGRLNRYAAKNDPSPCLVFPFSGEPYNEKPELVLARGDYRIEMAATRATVAELAGKPCSQRDLAVRLDRMNAAETFETYAAWLDDGWVTEPAAVRDSDNSVTLIRAEDLQEIEAQLGNEHARPSRWTSRSLVPWTIPMIYRRGFEPVRRVAGYPVAPLGVVEYTEQEGAEWQTKTN